MTQISQLTFFIFCALFFVISCQGNKIKFIQEEQEQISEIGDTDHKFCINLGLDFNVDKIETEIYYRCRIILVKHRLIDDETTPQAIRTNAMLGRYIENLQQDFSLAFEDLNNYRNSFIGNEHHKICTGRGFDMESLNQENIEKYLACRQNLIRSYKIDPPYKKTQYLNRPKDSYGIGFVINQQKDIEIAAINLEKEKYPQCAKIDVKSKDYKKCKDDIKNQEICFGKIKKSVFEKEMKERSICQRKLYVRFPDSLLKKEIKEEKEMERINRIADSINNNSFSSIGLNSDMIKNFYPEQKIIEPKIEEKKDPKEINTEDGLYDRAELNSLKQKFIAACNIEAQKEIDKFTTQLKNQCTEIMAKYQ